MLLLVFFALSYLLKQLLKWFGPGVLIVVHSEDLTSALFENPVVEVVSLDQPLLHFQISNVVVDPLHWVVSSGSVVLVSFEN